MKLQICADKCPEAQLQFDCSDPASCNCVNKLPSIHDQENVEIFKKQLSCTFYFLFLPSSPQFLSSNSSLSRSKTFSIPHHAFQSHSCHGLCQHQHSLLSSRHKAERHNAYHRRPGSPPGSRRLPIMERYCLYWRDRVLPACWLARRFEPHNYCKLIIALISFVHCILRHLFPHVQPVRLSLQHVIYSPLYSYI